MTLAGICNRCPHRSPPPYSGRMDCLYDPNNPVDTQERLRQRFCPAGKFDPNQLALLKMEQAGMSPEVVRAGEGNGCGCDPPTE